MTETFTFDAYYKWLGIPAEEQPPNHYRLLGIRTLESDRDVISNAADKQMAHIRSFQSGQHSALSQRILNEIAAARVCLLNAVRKAEYDLGFTTVAKPSTQYDLGFDVTAGAKHSTDHRPFSLKKRQLPQTAVTTGMICLGVVALIFIAWMAVPNNAGQAPQVTPLAIASPEPEPATSPAPTPERKPDPKPEPTPEAKPEPKPQPKPTAEPEPGPKPARQPQPRPGAKPEPVVESADQVAKRVKDALASAKTPADFRAVAVAALQLDDRAITAGTQSAAKIAVTLALVASRKADDGELVKAATLRCVEVERPFSSASKEEAAKRLARVGSIAPRSQIPMGVEEATKKSPVPDAAAQEQAAKLVRELFHDKASEAATAEQQTALSLELLHKAQTTGDDVAAQYVLFKEAAQVAMQAKDVDQTFQVIAEMGTRFEVDTLDLKVKLLTAMCKSSGTRQQSSAMVDSLLALMTEAATSEAFDVAKQLGATAIDLARRSRESAYVKETSSRIKAITADMAEVQAAQADVEEAVGVLDTNPSDTAANLTVGQYRCFMKNLWRKGIPMLALGDDPVLKSLAMKELKGVTEPVEQVKLGDAWWELADKKNHLAKKNVLSHAAYCYQESVPKLTGLMKEKVEKRLSKLNAAGIDGSDGHTSQPGNPDIAILLGVWDMSAGDYHSIWTFLKDGRVLSTNGIKEGKWSLEKTRVFIQWNNDTTWGSFNRPLDPAHTTGDGWRGKGIIIAKKLRNEKKTE